MNRAYSVLTIKSVDDAEGVIKGLATSPSPDRMGDVIDPEGVEYNFPIPLLWQHQSSSPIGMVQEARVTKKGIEVVARISRGVTEEIDRAWSLIKAGLVRGLSIGFAAKEYALMKDGGVHFSKWEWLELSAVTIPANADASIMTIKSIDKDVLAARGQGKRVVVNQSGVTDIAVEKPPTPDKVNVMKSVADQIKEFEEIVAAGRARMETLSMGARKEGRGLTDEERAEIRAALEDVGSAEQDLNLYRAMEKSMLASADVVSKDATGAGTVARRTPSRGGNAPAYVHRQKDAEEKFQGQNWTRKVIAKSLAFLSQGEASATEIAKARWGHTNPMLVEVIAKAAVPGGGTGTGEWGNELIGVDGRYTGDFIEFLHGLTVFDRLNLTEVPANITIRGQDGAATGYWVGESKAIPMSKPDFMAVTLSRLKVAGITTLSKELMEDSTPSAELLVRNALANALAERIDQTFFSADAAVAGVAPAGVLAGVAPVAASSGTDANAVRADLLALYGPFIAAYNATGLTVVTTPSLAKTVSLMRNPLGQNEFPAVNGGNIDGDTVLVGDNVPVGEVIMLKASDIYKIGDTGLEVSVSRDATIEQDSAPTGASDVPTAASANMVNMFQSDSVAVKVVRPMNFAKRRASAVQHISGAAYTLTVEP